MKIGFAGLGVMGAPIAGRLLAAGHSIRVYDLDPDAMHRLSDAGAAAADSPAAAAKDSEVFFTALPNAQALQKVLVDPESGAIATLSAGAVIADLGTGSPDDAARYAGIFRKREIAYLDCPISGGGQGARDGTLTVMAGGVPEAVDRVHPLLKTVGKNVIYTGQSGSAQMVKIINNMVACINIAAICEGYALGCRSGIDPELLIRVINLSSGRSYASEVKAPNFLLPKQFENAAKASIFRKDISLALDLAESLELDLELAHDTRQYLDALIAKGLGHLDATAISLLLE